MKAFLIFILSLTFTLTAFGQQDSGFTNKSEAKNLIVNGVKDGKWIEYYKVKNRIVHTTKSKRAPYYRLIMYKAGKVEGVARDYYKNGKLWCETPYVNGNISGVRKMYDENGTLVLTDTISGNKEKGMIKVFYPSGELKIECPFINDPSNTQSEISFEPQGAVHLYQEKKPTIPYGLRGKVNGVLKMFNEDGTVKMKITYLNGIENSSKN